MKAIALFIAAAVFLLLPAAALRLCDLVPDQYQLAAAGIVGGFILGVSFIGAVYCAISNK